MKKNIIIVAGGGGEISSFGGGSGCGEHFVSLKSLRFEQEKITTVGGISNYYGGLLIKKDDGKYFWGIENHNGTGWEEIPKKLYDTLISFEKKRLKK
jgi:hypothetical protein